MPRLDPRFARFVLLVAVVLGILLFPWPGAGAAFAASFCRMANWVSADLRWHSVVGIDFEPNQVVGAESSSLRAAWSAAVRIRNIPTGTATPAFALDLRSLAYAPLSVLVSLAVAAPNRGKPIWLRSHLVGFALVGGFTLLSIALAITWMLSHVWIADPDSLLDGDRVHLVALGTIGDWAVGALHGAFAATGAPAAAVLWVVAWKLTAREDRWPWSAPERPFSKAVARSRTTMERRP